MQQEYSIQDLWKIFIKNILIILVVAIVVGGSVFAIMRRHVTTQYTARRSMLIYHGKTDYSRTDIMKSDMLGMGTYTQVMNDPSISDVIYQQMKGTKNFTGTKADVNRMTIATAAPNSTIMTVNATAANKAVAIKLANVSAVVAKEKLPQYIGASAKVRLLANANERPVDKITTSNAKKMAVYATAGSLVLAALIVFGADILKKNRK
ncbi:YveK family protein [Furfurilactobacillus entadae]|uniref:hypothetical protein n=1 Tax=Furfurilactobacillus entadae TaxID=2922307 RepID=UPI0035EC35E7